jgi:hypothetical protein
MRGETIAAAQKATIIHDKAELLALPESSRTNIGNVSTLDAPSPPSTRCAAA